MTLSISYQLPLRGHYQPSTASRYGKGHVLISMYHFNRMVCDDCQNSSMLYNRINYDTVSIQQTCILTMISMLCSLFHLHLFIHYLFISLLSWPKIRKYNVLNMLNQNVTKSISHNLMHVTYVLSSNFEQHDMSVIKLYY
jgi:hypothetical protein